MLTRLEDYLDRYESAHLERHDGILQIRLHTDEGPILSGGLVHSEIPALFADVGNDLDNRCIILTGTGDAFWPGRQDESPHRSGLTNEEWYRVVRRGTKIITNFLEIPVPVIAAVNGPCSRHSELVVLSDIVLATPNTVFQDAPHFWNGLVPGDGVVPAWLAAIGPSRARYFLLTGQQLNAEEAFRLGVVSEIVPPELLLDRAWELASEIVKRSALTLRYTKMLLVAEFRRLMNEQLSFGLILEGAAHAEEGGQDMGLVVRRTTEGDGTGFDRARISD